MQRLFLFLLFTSAMSASPLVDVTLLGAGNLSTPGGDSISPYLIAVEQAGGGATITLDAWCDDFLDTIVLDQTWTANADTLVQAATTGRFSWEVNALGKYETAAVLTSFTPTSQQNQIDIQEDLWNIFDPVAFSVTAGMTTMLADATAGIPTFNFSTVDFLEPTLAGVGQEFIIDAPPGGWNVVVSPEPSTWFMALIGVGLVWMKRK